MRGVMHPSIDSVVCRSLGLARLGSGLRVRRPAAAELLDQGRAVEAEELGGSVLVAAGADEGLADHLFFDRLEDGLQVGAGLGEPGDVATPEAGVVRGVRMAAGRSEGSKVPLP